MNVYLEELAWRVCGYTEKQAQEKINQVANIDNELMERFYIDAHHFGLLIRELVKFTPPSASPITGEAYQGFIDLDNKSFLFKQPIKESK